MKLDDTSLKNMSSIVNEAPDEKVMLFEEETRRNDCSTVNLVVSSIQHLNAVSPRRNIPRVPNVEVHMDAKVPHVVDEQGYKWLVPTDIAESMLRSRAQEDIRTYDDLKYDDAVWASDFQQYELIDDKKREQERAQGLEPIIEGQPGYWAHWKVDGVMHSLPVYGYMADRGRRQASPPALELDEDGKVICPDWDNAEYLFRCAQCGRELPPLHFPLNARRRPKTVCKGCISINRTADALYSQPPRYWRDIDQDFMAQMRLLYIKWWCSGLSPRGDYARHLIGPLLNDRIYNTMARNASPQGPSTRVSQKHINEHFELINEIERNYDFAKYDIQT